MEPGVLNERSKDWLSRPTCSVTQFAEMVGMSRNAVYVAIERGDVPVIRIGRRILIPTGPVRKLLQIDEGATGTAEAA